MDGDDEIRCLGLPAGPADSFPVLIPDFKQDHQIPVGGNGFARDHYEVAVFPIGLCLNPVKG